jgi:uncharacterized protein YciI
MAYFMVRGTDRPDSGDLRGSLREGHRSRLRRHDHPVRVHVGGPLLDGEGAMVGTLLIVEAADAAAVAHYMAGDPYCFAGLFETLDIVPFAWGLGTPDTKGKRDGNDST